MGFCHCVLANLLWLFLLGSCPFRCLLCCLLDGKPQIWPGGSASCLVLLVVCVLVFMICQAACDHLCPCRSFLNNSFFSCKDRALERDRPYQRKKSSCCKESKAAALLLVPLDSFVSWSTAVVIGSAPPDPKRLPPSGARTSSSSSRNFCQSQSAH